MGTRESMAPDGLLEGPVRRLTILYDERCPKCVRWAAWLTGQRFLVPVELLPAGSSEARTRYPHVARWLVRELVVVDNEARAWVGPAAFVMCLWATNRYRWTASLATRPMISPVASAYFRHLTRRRGRHLATLNDEGFLSCDESDWCAEGGSS